MTSSVTCSLSLLLFLTAARLSCQSSRGTISVNVSHNRQRGSAAKAREVNPFIEQRFSQIYENKEWSEAGRGSGTGSTREATVVTSSIIRLVANKYGLHSWLDCPCGALEWQPFLLQQLKDDFPDFSYFGIDVVPSVIQANMERFSNMTNMKFETRDLSSEGVPKGYDLILSRDALQHLPCEETVNVLRNFAAARPRLLLLGSYDEPRNINIPVGAYHSINLRLPPFDLLGGVVATYSEYTNSPTDPNKFLLLFTGDYLMSRDFDAMKSACAAIPTLEQILNMTQSVPQPDPQASDPEI